MKVFKFGGASVKDAEAIKNVGSILLQFEQEPLLVVVSAIGKTTNKLEECLTYLLGKDQLKYDHSVHALRDFHIDIASALFHDHRGKVFRFINDIFEQLKNKFNKPLAEQHSFEYFVLYHQ
jgi:aspartate kinase